jgi:hypothetical protein
MRGVKILFAAGLIWYLSFLSRPVPAVTLNYNSRAQAVFGEHYGDYLGFPDVWMFSWDVDKDANNPSIASIYQDRHNNISTSASAAGEPNKVTLFGSFAGAYELSMCIPEMPCPDNIYIDANGTIEGWIQVTEFPAGTPCALQVNVSFPQATWTELWAWQVYIESSLDCFLAGRNNFGDYGHLSGTITAYAGEQVYVFFAITGSGGGSDGGGSRTVNVVLTPIPHPADFCRDGSINFRDLAVFSSQWLQQNCTDPNTSWCQKADLDRSGKVDASDMELFAGYWLLHPDPNLVP